MGINDLLVILACLAAMAGAILIAQALHKARLRRITEAGVALGLRALGPGDAITLPATELLRRPRRFLGAAFEGEWQGVPVQVFDLYHPGGRPVVRQTVLVTRHPEQLPEFALIERDWQKYRPAVDIPPAADAPPELRRSWYVHSRDGSWPFGEALTRWLAPRTGASPFSPHWSYEGAGSRVMVYRRARLASAKRLKDWLDEACAEAQGFAAQVSGTRGESDDVTPEKRSAEL